MLRLLLTIGCLLVLSKVVSAEALTLEEPSTDKRVFNVTTTVKTSGKLKIGDNTSKATELPLDATANFSFRERRLPPAGRDALALRAIREFTTAKMTAEIEEQTSTLALPNDSRMIIANGRREGLLNYSNKTLLTRDLIDLLDIPADSLTLIGLLPDETVDVDSEWQVPEWAAQMLCGIEAIESAAVTAKITSADESSVTIRLSGSVKGLRDGAVTAVDVSGTVTWSATESHISAADLKLNVTAEVGAVSPGIDAEVSIAMKRAPTKTLGNITDTLVSSIPLEAPPTALELVFDAPPWQTRFLHSRDWHLFQAVLDAPPKVAIFRLIENGSLICQCNVSPIPDAPPGEHTPLETFASDIQSVLGDAFIGFKSQDTKTLNDGRVIVSVLVEGQVDVQGGDKAVSIPMQWNYYISADPNGRQMSFVFAVEPDLLETLGTHDLDFVKSAKFLPVRQAGR